MGTTEVTGTMLRPEPISTTGCGTVEGDYWDMPVNTVHAIADGGAVDILTHRGAARGDAVCSLPLYRGNWLHSYRHAQEQCRINANRGPWQLFVRAPLFTRDKDLSQPATRVDTTCWQLFRPDINTAHFLFFVAEVMSNYLTTDGLKIFSLLP